MEEEKFFSGYCRQIDQSRMVSAVKENGELVEVDCCYESCIYRPNCTVGQAIDQFLENTDNE